MSNCESIHMKSRRYTRTMPRLLLSSLVMLGSCTTESVYNLAQEVQLQRCEEQPIPAQDACKAQFELSYDDYKRERDALILEGRRGSNR